MKEASQQKMIVCISSYPPDEKQKMTKMITSLGGCYAENFTNHVTVLISGVSATPKYNVFLYKIPKIGCDSSKNTHCKI